MAARQPNLRAAKRKPHSSVADPFATSERQVSSGNDPQEAKWQCERSNDDPPVANAAAATIRGQPKCTIGAATMIRGSRLRQQGCYARSQSTVQRVQRSVKGVLAAALIRRQPAGSNGDQSAANLRPLTGFGSPATPNADQRTFRQPAPQGRSATPTPPARLMEPLDSSRRGARIRVS